MTTPWHPKETIDDDVDFTAEVFDIFNGRFDENSLGVTLDGAAEPVSKVSDPVYQRASDAGMDDESTPSDNSADEADAVYEHAVSGATIEPRERESMVADPLYSYASVGGDLDVTVNAPPVPTSERVSKVVYPVYAHASHGDLDYGTQSEDDFLTNVGDTDLTKAWEVLKMGDNDSNVDDDHHVERTNQLPSMAMKRAKNMSRKLQPSHSTGSTASLEL